MISAYFATIQATLDRYSLFAFIQDVRITFQKEMLFRYDNARHKPPLNQLEHKHIGNEIKLVAGPTLDDVLLEIVTANGWV